MALLPKCGTRSYVLCYVLISIAYLQISHFLSSAEIETTVCETPECKQLGEYYEKIINPDGGACDDFYDYVCHNPLEPAAISNIKKHLEENQKIDNSDANESTLTSLVLSAKSMLQRQVSESKWLDPNLQKAWIQFADGLDTVEKTAGTEAVTHVNNHTIGISAALLQFPIFDANVAPVVQYGAFISAVGRGAYHGLTHDLDSKQLPLQTDEEQQKVSEAFQKRAKCFTNRYNEYKKIKNGQNPENNIDFPITANDLISDLMGLKLAYRAYQDKFPIEYRLPEGGTPIYAEVYEQPYGNCTVLPGFEGFSCEQLFFIAHASSLCPNSSPIAEANASPAGVPNAASVRVNLAVVSMSAFRSAFGCSGVNAGPLMVIQDCDLWRQV